MAFDIDEDAVRNKNKDLLLTDKILTAEVETAIADAKQIVLTRTYEFFDTSIVDSYFTPAMNIAVKLIACAILLRDNYSSDELALKLADSYYSEANTLIKSIVKGKELSKVTGVTKLDNPRSFTSATDTRTSNFSAKLNSKYR